MFQAEYFCLKNFCENSVKKIYLHIFRKHNYFPNDPVCLIKRKVTKFLLIINTTELMYQKYFRIRFKEKYKIENKNFQKNVTGLLYTVKNKRKHYLLAQKILFLKVQRYMQKLSPHIFKIYCGYGLGSDISFQNISVRYAQHE